MTSESNLQEAQRILIRCGAVSYCVDRLLRRQREAHKIQDDVPLLHGERIVDLLDQIIAPIRRLFDVLGIPQPITTIAWEPGFRQG